MTHANAPVGSSIGDKVKKASCHLLYFLHAQDTNTYIWSIVLS